MHTLDAQIQQGLIWLQALILYTTVVSMCTTCFNILYFGISLIKHIYEFQFQNKCNNFLKTHHKLI